MAISAAQKEYIDEFLKGVGIWTPETAGQDMKKIAAQLAHDIVPYLADIDKTSIILKRELEDVEMLRSFEMLKSKTQIPRLATVKLLNILSLKFKREDPNIRWICDSKAVPYSLKSLAEIYDEGGFKGKEAPLFNITAMSCEYMRKDLRNGCVDLTLGKKFIAQEMKKGRVKLLFTPKIAKKVEPNANFAIMYLRLLSVYIWCLALKNYSMELTKPAKYFSAEIIEFLYELAKTSTLAVDDSENLRLKLKIPEIEILFAQILYHSLTKLFDELPKGIHNHVLRGMMRKRRFKLGQANLDKANAMRQRGEPWDIDKWINNVTRGLLKMKEEDLFISYIPFTF